MRIMKHVTKIEHYVNKLVKLGRIGTYYFALLANNK